MDLGATQSQLKSADPAQAFNGLLGYTEKKLNDSIL
jgi:hypothetical protein